VSESGITTNWFRFGSRFGYYYDADLNVCFIRARSYAPSAARFLSADPINPFPFLLSIIQRDAVLDRYAYCMNNFTNRLDPSGRAGEAELNKCLDDYHRCVWNSQGWTSNPPPDSCVSAYYLCLKNQVPPDSIVSLPANSPECNRYKCDDTYAGANARCFCKCAGDTPWSQFVRGCLRKLYDEGISPSVAHRTCYDLADSKYGAGPSWTLFSCYVLCQPRRFPTVIAGTAAT
jgi:RHS repeat-associated protein